MKLRVNASLEQATPFLEEFAKVASTVALIEAKRDEAVRETNAISDTLIAPHAARMTELREQIEAWWCKVGFGQLPPKRKTMALLGCTIGSKAGRASLAMPADEDAAIKALKGTNWGPGFIRVTEAIDKAVVRAGLKLEHADNLKAIGFGETNPGELFVLEPLAQVGTIGKAAA